MRWTQAQFCVFSSSQPLVNILENIRRLKSPRRLGVEFEQIGVRR